MNFSELLLDSIQKNGATSINGFGTFYLKNTNALVDQESKNILPPGNEIAFSTEFDGVTTDFPKFIASEKKSSIN